MAKSNSDLVRVNMNLPRNIVNQVKNYADSIGVNTTNAYIYLINQALEQKNAMAQLPMLFSLMNTLQNQQSTEELKEMFDKLGAEK